MKSFIPFIKNLFFAFVGIFIFASTATAQIQRLDGNIYPDTLNAQKVIINQKPTTGSTANKVLVRDTTTGEVKEVAQASLQGTATDPTAIRQGGNSFGTGVVIGSNDNQQVILKANNTNRVAFTESTFRILDLPQKGLDSVEFILTYNVNADVVKTPKSSFMTPTSVQYATTNSGTTGNSQILTNTNPFTVVNPLAPTQRMTVQLPTVANEGQVIEVYLGSSCNGFTFTAPTKNVNNGMWNGAMTTGRLFRATLVASTWYCSRSL